MLNCKKQNLKQKTFFYHQLITGDATDNIKGANGAGPAKAKAILDNLPESEWLEAIGNLYASEEELDMNARCLYIWRRPDDYWKTLLVDS